MQRDSIDNMWRTLFFSHGNYSTRVQDVAPVPSDRGTCKSALPNTNFAATISKRFMTSCVVSISRRHDMTYFSLENGAGSDSDVHTCWERPKTVLARLRYTTHVETSLEGFSFRTRSAAHSPLVRTVSSVHVTFEIISLSLLVFARLMVLRQTFAITNTTSASYVFVWA